MLPTAPAGPSTVSGPLTSRLPCTISGPCTVSGPRTVFPPPRLRNAGSFGGSCSSHAAVSGPRTKISPATLSEPLTALDNQRTIDAERPCFDGLSVHGRRAGEGREQEQARNEARIRLDKEVFHFVPDRGGRALCQEFVDCRSIDPGYDILNLVCLL